MKPRRCAAAAEGLYRSSETVSPTGLATTNSRMPRGYPMDRPPRVFLVLPTPQQLSDGSGLVALSEDFFFFLSFFSLFSCGLYW